MEKLERLINLVAALIAAERALARDELRQRVPGYPVDDTAFRRAFERDKEALRGMGIPISIEALNPLAPEEGDGYRIQRDEYELTDPGLDVDELAALHLAASAVRLEGGEATAAIWKLGGAAGGPSEGEEVALAGSEHLAPLFAGVSLRQAVTFDYRDAVRTVDPWRLGFRNGRWYLTGRDHGRDGSRQFRLDRMGTPRLIGDARSFDRPKGTQALPPPPWAMGEEEPITAQVLVDAEQADWAISHVGADAVFERREDGSAVLSLEVTNRPAFRSLVLGFLDHAEVLGPPSLRAEMVSWLSQVASA